MAGAVFPRLWGWEPRRGARSGFQSSLLALAVQMVAPQIQRLLKSRQQLPRLGGHKLVTVPVQLRDYFELAGDALLAFHDVALGLGKRVFGMGHLRLELGLRFTEHQDR